MTALVVLAKINLENLDKHYLSAIMISEFPTIQVLTARIHYPIGRMNEWRNLML